MLTASQHVRSQIGVLALTNNKEKHMGMYTEIFMRAELAGDMEENALDVLRALVGGYAEDLTPGQIPAHEFFQCHRWKYIATMSSAYFPKWDGSHIATSSDWGGHLEVFIHANLKNYDGEIEKFFDWINPYLSEGEGEFIGYSLYEEGDNPVLHFKK